MTSVPARDAATVAPVAGGRVRIGGVPRPPQHGRGFHGGRACVPGRESGRCGQRARLAATASWRARAIDRTRALSCGDPRDVRGSRRAALGRIPGGGTGRCAPGRRARRFIRVRARAARGESRHRPSRAMDSMGDAPPYRRSASTHASSLRPRRPSSSRATTTTRPRKACGSGRSMRSSTCSAAR